MGLRVNTNIAALNSYRNLSATDTQMGKSLEKLSSGLRINRAADDAAGLAISEGLRSQIGGLKVAVRNTQDGISVVQTAEGALTETHSILQRMRDLAVQASSDGGLNNDAKSAIQSEMTQLKSELTRIADTTQFNGKKLLDGSYSGKFQVGANAGETISVAVGTAMDITGLKVDGVDVRGGTATTATTTNATGTTAGNVSIAAAQVTDLDD
jgi:flagellin-like hook-associated protein FlgL